MRLCCLIVQKVLARTEHRVEDDLLGFPEERHRHRERQQDEKNEQQVAEPARPDEQLADRQRRMRRLGEPDESHGKKQQRDEQPAVERGELAGFLAQGFVRQHRGEALEHEVQVEQEQHGGKFQHHDGGAEEKFPRHPVVPVDERAQSEVDERQEQGAIQCVPPRTLLFLEITHLPEAVEEQGVDGERGQNAERFQPVGAGGLGGNEQRRGQSPKQRGQSAREFAERTKQLRIGRRHRGNDIAFQVSLG